MKGVGEIMSGSMVDGRSTMCCQIVGIAAGQSRRIARDFVQISRVRWERSDN